MIGELANAAVANLAAATPFLQLAGLRRVFGEHIAVAGLDLAVRPGEYLTLLGPSGCGKTTTLRMLAGFIAPSAGEISIDGQPITALPPERRPVNTVFQDYALFPHLTVRQNVEYGLRVRKVAAAERRARVDELLAHVELSALAERYPRSLSGGQQQRVALARALVCRPRLLLLDEPLGALDARLRLTMQGLLKQLQRSFQIAFIHVTHDQSEALALSDRVVVMRNGAIAQVGTPTELYQRPASPFVADFLGTTNLLAGRCVQQTGALVTLTTNAPTEQDAATTAATTECFGTTAGTFAPGNPLWLAVRPAAINIDRSAWDSDETRTQLTGTVVDAVYRGEDWLVRVRCGQTELLVATNVPLVSGQSVQLSWAASDAWVMRP